MKLIIKKLSKNYRNKKALDNINLELHNGIYGLLGPNGAGKTTLIHSIVKIIDYDGLIEFYDDNGDNIKEFYDIIGYLPQYPCFYKNFTIYEMLEYIGTLKNISKDNLKTKIETVLDKVNLLGSETMKIKELSGGMKQRLGIAQAIINDPKILIVDEPTAGLDPKERIRFRNVLKTISKDTIIIFATHIVSDIELIATDIIILKSGKMLINKKREEVFDSIIEKVWEFNGSKEETDILMKSKRIVEAYWVNDSVHVRLINDTIPDEKAYLSKPRLEDLYMYYFGDEE